jgi:hypothetical protein
MNPKTEAMLKTIDLCVKTMQEKHDELKAGVLTRLSPRVGMLRHGIVVAKFIRGELLRIEHTVEADECECCTKGLLDTININFGLGKDN